MTGALLFLLAALIPRGSIAAAPARAAADPAVAAAEKP
jgi:hypothetical protein